MTALSKFRVALVVPILNPGPAWIDWLNAFQTQTLRPEFLLVVDSDSRDGTPEKAIPFGFKVHTIERSSFVHGATRQWSIDQLPEADIVVFMTQDAVLADPDSLKNLIAAFENPEVGAAYGRQLPRKNASPIEAHARTFNYPVHPRIKSFADIPELGIKTAFFSNSFGAFRRWALLEIGGFPVGLNFGEDVYAASKLLLAGWKVAYVSNATVFHSHRYSFLEEFRRYVEVGTFYGQEGWIVQDFGKAGGEGRKFVFSELSYLIPRHMSLIPSALLRTALKFIGYHVGKARGRRMKPVHSQ
jgi:rhamnosyltransferase